MTVRLLTEHNLEFLSLKGGSTGLSESILVKMPHCWKSLVVAKIRTVVAFQEEEIKEDTEVKTEEEPKPKPRRKKKKQTGRWSH